jgi:hypothetical protein
LDRHALERLGHYIVSRHVALGYRNRTDLANSLKFTVRTLSDIENGVRKASPGTYAVLETSWPGHREASTPSWPAANPRSWWSSSTGTAPNFDTTPSPPTLCPGASTEKLLLELRRRIIRPRHRRHDTWDDWDSLDARGDWDGLDSEVTGPKRGNQQTEENRTNHHAVEQRRKLCWLQDPAMARFWRNGRSLFGPTRGRRAEMLSRSFPPRFLPTPSSARGSTAGQPGSNTFHPHIVGVHARGEFHGQLWLAMDYIDGTDA